MFAETVTETAGDLLGVLAVFAALFTLILIVGVAVSTIISLASPLPAACGHVAGRRWRERKAHRTNITVVELDARSRTHPTALLYLYAFVASVTTMTALSFMWIATAFVLGTLGEVNDSFATFGDVAGATTDSPGAYIIIGIGIAAGCSAAFTVAFTFAKHLIPKRRQQHAANQLKSI